MEQLKPDWGVDKTEISGHFHPICVNAYISAKTSNKFYWSYTYCHDILCSNSGFNMALSHYQQYWVKFTVNKINLKEIINKFFYLFELTQSIHNLKKPILEIQDDDIIVVKLEVDVYSDISNRLFVLKLLRMCYYYNYETFGQLMLNHLFYKNIFRQIGEPDYADDMYTIQGNRIGWFNYLFNRRRHPKHQGFLSYQIENDSTLYSRIWDSEKGKLQL